MKIDWLRFWTVTLLAALCAGLIGFLWLAFWPNAGGKINAEMGGWITACFLAIREFISKIEKIVNRRTGEVEIVNDPSNPVPVEEE